MPVLIISSIIGSYFYFTRVFNKKSKNGNEKEKETTVLKMPSSSTGKPNSVDENMSKTIIMTFLAFSAIFLNNAIRFKIPVITQYIKEDPNFTNITTSQETFILGSYFYGYVVSQIPLALLGKCISNQKILGWSFILTGLANVAIYFFYDKNADLIGILRILIGLLQGGSYPLIHGIWHEFANKENLSNLVSIEYAGGGFGAFLAGPICTLAFFDYEKGGHWKNAFLVFGILPVIFGVFWLIYFSKLEKTGEIQRSQKMSEFWENFYRIPWISILTSSVFWGLAIPQIASNYASYTVQLLTVKYAREYLGQSLKTSGLISAIPVLAKPFCCIFAGYVSMKLIQNSTKIRNTDNRLKIRKSLSWILFSVSSLSYIIVIFLKNNLLGCIVCWTVIMGMDGFGPAAFKANFIEISPANAGLVFSIANMFGNCPGFVAPIVSEFILDAYSNNLSKGWSLVFLQTGIACIFGAIVFQFYGTVERQEWDKNGDRSDKINSDELECQKLRDEDMTVEKCQREDKKNLGDKNNLLSE